MTEKQNYKVLARKYRPQKFQDLVGQDLLVEILSKSINSGRTAHAYLLTGVRGVGKTTTARLIAMSINCTKRSKDSCEPCGNCVSCKSVVDDSDLDVIEMDAASNTGVDDIREIIENVKYKPVSNAYKIFIIDEVHMLSTSAFNALLKTLEEPPEHVKFIFATTEVKKIPITVISRCQRFDLNRIENSILSQHLLKISNLENVKIDNDALSLVVRAADGSVRDALSLLDQAILSSEENISSKSIVNMLGLADRIQIFELLQNMLEGKTTEALAIYKKIYDMGADVNMIFEEILNVVHFLTQLKISPKLKDDIYIPEIERIKGAEIATNLSLNNLSIVWQILFKGFQELQHGIHLYQHGEMIILRVIYFYDGDNPDNLLKKNNDLKNGENLNETIQNSQKKNIQESKHINFNKSDIEKKNLTKFKQINLEIKNFRQFVEMFFKKKEGILHTKLYNDVTLISFKEGEVVLNTEKIIDNNFNRNVAKLISKWTGRIWQIHSSKSNIGKSLHSEDIINQQKQIEVMKNHTDVKNILNLFPKTSIHSISDIGEIQNKDDEINKIIEGEQ